MSGLTTERETGKQSDPSGAVTAARGLPKIVGSSLVGAWRGGRGRRFPSPAAVERLRSFLLAQERPRDATMVSVLAYVGLRPWELLTLRWSDVGKRSLRVCGATANGVTQRARRVPLLEPVAEDLALWRETCESPGKDALVFSPSQGGHWSDDEWAAWREEVFRPALESCGMETLNPMDLRNTFCGLSLLEGTTTRRLAHQMGTTTKEIRERSEVLPRNLVEGLGRISAEEEIRKARWPGSPLDEAPPFALFGGVPEDAWRWLHLEGREACPFLGRYLPGLTGDSEFESMVVGSGGTEALAQGFEIYELFKRLYERHANPLTSESRVLDFGCGWGRVIRFFLKEVAPDNLVGIDIDQRMLGASRETNRWCRFQHCEPFPPTEFEPDSFDLVYAFSVFSHLSEEAHQRWLEEFERLLRPDGVLILTTFPREFLSRCSDGSSYVGDGSLSLEQWFSVYDRGEYCYRKLKGVHHPHFGDAFIPERYVRRHWTKQFIAQDYVAAPDLGQNVVVCTKRR
jgi:SAM-dependent methyltransferase